MLRIVYCAGPYRHYLADGSYNRPAMEDELADERSWCEIIARAGHVPFGPLGNSVPIERALSEEDWIERDLEIIRRLRSDHDVFIVRPGAFGTADSSEGVARELCEARSVGLIVIHSSVMGVDAVKRGVLRLALDGELCESDEMAWGEPGGVA